uniref:Tubulin tyrosine ligase like 11 n=1 Tax=Equus asinus TaxID=9793 RepID=A0A9L0I5S3_EQUAS
MVKDGDPSWKPTFIVKPDGGCQGDGIYLIKDPNDIRLAGTLQSRPAVVQEYICKPLLIDKLKFDIRLYVLLKSLDPLEIYIAKDGLSRFCTEPYQEPSPKNLHHIFMHLTNYSLNIHSGNFVHSDSTSTGSKRTFSSILCRLSSKGVDIKKVWSDIISLVIKTVIALTPELKVFYQSDIPAGRPGPTCFQVTTASSQPEFSTLTGPTEGSLASCGMRDGVGWPERGGLLVGVKPGSNFQFFDLLAVWFGASYFPFLTCKMRLIVPFLKDSCKN